MCFCAFEQNDYVVPTSISSICRACNFQYVVLTVRYGLTVGLIHDNQVIQRVHNSFFICTSVCNLFISSLHLAH